jgi:hypothetical protein
LSQQFSLSLSHFGVDIQFNSSLQPDSIKDGDGFLGLLKRMGGGGLLGGGVAGGLAFLGIGFLPIILASLATGAVVSFFFGSDPGEIIVRMKQEVYDKGFEKFGESLEQIEENIAKGLIKAIDSQYENAIKAIQYSISILDEILKKQDDLYQETVDIKNKKKSFASQGILHLSVIEERLNNFPIANE